MRFQAVLAAIAAVATAHGAPRISVEAPSSGIGEYRELAKFAKEVGATHLGACQVEPSLWQWDEYGRSDPYPNWSMHRPSIFKFVVPPELAKYIPADYAKRNLDTLRARFAVLSEFGLKATFDGMEPAYLPEAAYCDHPNWRGPACQHSRRSRHEYFAPCLDDAEFRAIYVRAIADLCRAAPFESFNLLVNDSGSGLCWCPHSYPGMNGPEACAGRSFSSRVVNFLSCFQEGAAAAGLGEAKVNIARYLQRPVDVDAITKALKPGQSVLGRTANGKSASFTVGFPNCFAEYTYPVAYMPRVARMVEQLQEAQRHPDADILFAVKGVEDLDAIALGRHYLKRNIGDGPAARARVLEEIAGEFVAKELVATLADIWTDIEKIESIFAIYSQGGHVFLLGGTHQRWLTRPFVPFPEELSEEERSWWRPYIFQAQDEKTALNPMDLQGGQWMSGVGPQLIFGWLTMERVRPTFRRAIAAAESLAGKGLDAQKNKYLRGLAMRLKFYRDVAELHALVVQYQFHLEDWRKHHGDKLLPESSDFFRLQGEGNRLNEVNRYNRQIVELSRAMADELDAAEAAGVELVQCAPSDKFETVMTLPPVRKLAAEMRRRADVMWAHRRDHERIWRGRNP